ncbi:MAG: hypothetical protein PVH29_11805 [Candidatus Zixiibacteriota bacterium]|jgi:hypothetical protein
MSGELKEELRRLGADVRPGSEMPNDVREMIEAYAPGLPRAGQVGVELKRLARDQVYTYEDPYLKLLIPVPPLDIFEAVVRELERLGPDLTDIHEYVTVIGRAFWLLHRKPERRGFLRKRYALREPTDDEALKFLEEKVKRADVVIKSLAPALFGLIEFVMYKKKEGADPQDTAA